MWILDNFCSRWGNSVKRFLFKFLVIFLCQNEILYWVPSAHLYWGKFWFDVSLAWNRSQILNTCSVFLEHKFTHFSLPLFAVVIEGRFIMLWTKPSEVWGNTFELGHWRVSRNVWFDLSSSDFRGGIIGSLCKLHSWFDLNLSRLQVVHMNVLIKLNLLQNYELVRHKRSVRSQLLKRRNIFTNLLQSCFILEVENLRRLVIIILSPIFRCDGKFNTQLPFSRIYKCRGI